MHFKMSCRRFYTKDYLGAVSQMICYTFFVFVFACCSLVPCTWPAVPHSLSRPHGNQQAGGQAHQDNTEVSSCVLSSGKQTTCLSVYLRVFMCARARACVCV